MSDLNVLKPQIGKRIYVVDVQKMVVVPARVKEKVIRETIKGVETSYMLDFGVEGSENVSSDAIREQPVVSTSDEAFALLKLHIEKMAKSWQDSKLHDAKKIVSTAVVNGDERFGRELVTKTSPDHPRDIMGAPNALDGVMARYKETSSRDKRDDLGTLDLFPQDLFADANTELQKKQRKVKTTKTEEIADSENEDLKSRKV